HIRIVTPAPVAAEGAGPAGRRRLTALLEQRGIAVTLGARYRAVEPGHIRLEDGEDVPYDRTIWTPPYAGSQLARASGIDDGYGWIPTDGYLRHPEWPSIYAVGDIGRLTVPKHGHQALIQARVAVTHLWATLHGRTPPAPYRPWALWALETGDGRALLDYVAPAPDGGLREWAWWGRPVAWAKDLFVITYLALGGHLPWMP
ncbi:MAG: FAD-dependent oxidoreductase, partial [Firmicutes bacterium]|nr:FAD-dependent oxidoreductase [Bacillota bacterium]